MKSLKTDLMKNKIILAIGLITLLTMTWTVLTQLFNTPSHQFSLTKRTLQSASSTEETSDHADSLIKNVSPFIMAQFASHESTPEVHSATAIELGNNNIMAFWYGGTREGHQDVTIYQNTWHNKTQQWGQEKSILTRAFTRDGTSRYIRKLGNPVVTRASDNSIWLFYVSVSVGGWAGSAINLTRSYDEGQSWSVPKRLITSPFLNLSTLIKGTPVHYTDGTIGLPVYHELLGKFGELLKLNKNGDVIDKIRLSWGKTSLQPILFPLSSDNAIAMMRYQGKAPMRILTQTSSNAGINWTTAEKSTLPNPGAGIIGLFLYDTDNLLANKGSNTPLLLAFNNDEEERDDMTLATSIDNGLSWQVAHAVEENKLAPPNKNQQFSYPWLLQTKNGNIHLLYTWHKSHIKHVIFNTTWLTNTLPAGGLK
ncbi:MAG: exo-alpha-sialidase [gamma proteobacterium symbiont of Bathyaustriella thionipta]|nr:exo-alpha-sialidase [gamma proteobacterium symbiont of Bathyaustriella thionipta]MCU7948443.1 exo-alpha-sialidase [gamma proteobacterium symbiont of Bathyaustriella thionipta]MCU7954142.1 exo-alpha-sialidase [gamma proteobacterium symbiont of Bathyaustriella thionipta]MCU7955993.1 exo-alpha-sialidase [gamma proteobacterium symbiont of Bathyaustriella thionipta]MCU7968164.1 exo-alpha-sialidase [gamma proteobacterium symbiont of Bathyaustriella thionipta]